MALTNAEKQARFRERRDAELARLRHESSYRPGKRDKSTIDWLRRSHNLQQALTLPHDNPYDIERISQAIMELIEPTGFAPKIVAALRASSSRGGGVRRKTDDDS